MDEFVAAWKKVVRRLSGPPPSNRSWPNSHAAAKLLCRFSLAALQKISDAERLAAAVRPEPRCRKRFFPPVALPCTGGRDHSGPPAEWAIREFPVWKLLAAPRPMTMHKVWICSPLNSESVPAFAGIPFVNNICFNLNCFLILATKFLIATNENANQPFPQPAARGSLLPPYSSVERNSGTRRIGTPPQQPHLVICASQEARTVVCDISVRQSAPRAVQRYKNRQICVIHGRPERDRWGSREPEEERREM